MEDYSEMTMDDIWTDEDIRIMAAEQKEIDKTNRKEAIIWAIQQRCEPCQDYRLNLIEKWFYTCKVIICLIINRSRGMWTEDKVEVGYWNYRGGYNDSWMQVNVGHGIFKDWHFDIYENSSY